MGNLHIWQSHHERLAVASASERWCPDAAEYTLLVDSLAEADDPQSYSYQHLDYPPAANDFQSKSPEIQKVDKVLEISTYILQLYLQ